MLILPRNIQALACCAGACLQSSFCTWGNFNRRKWGIFNRRKLGNIQPALTAWAEARKTNASLSAKIAAETDAQQAAQQQISGQVDELKEANTSTSSKLDAINGDVTGVKGDVASTQSAVQATNTELKRVNGDMGVMSGLIATNGKELAELRELGDRNYVEFDLKRTKGMQKVGNLELALAKVDPKRNRFTLDVMADDKRVEKRDKTVNEPVQLYMAGYRQPVEIVVNEVKKDEVVGYVAVPKVKATRP
jgi:hypothetical protein